METKKANTMTKWFGKGNRANTWLNIACWAAMALGVVLAAVGAWQQFRGADGPLTATYRDDTVYVEAMYSKEAKIPGDAQLRAYLVTPESDPESYSKKMAAAMTATGRDGETPQMNAIYHVGFYVGEEEIEPAAPVNVVIQALQNGFAVGDPIQVVHLGEDEAQLIADTSVDDAGFVSFTTDGFSDFAFMYIAAPQVPDMKGLVGNVTITDQKGEEVKDGKLYVGEKYSIHLEFQEKGAQSGDEGQFQWSDDGKMTYQIPKNFEVEQRSDVELKAVVDGEEVVIGKFSIDENGVLTVELNDAGKKALEGSSSFALSFDMDATAQQMEGGSDEDVHFGDTGENFKFVVTDQPQITVEKLSDYHSDTQILEYTVHTTVDHGPIQDVVVSDVLTPPQTPGITLEMLDDISAKVMRGGEPIELTAEDYELVPVTPDPANPYALQTFQVKLKEGSKYASLQTGDELFVNYQYKANFDQSAADRFFGQVVNEATVTGSMPMKDPQTGGETIVPVEEKRGSYAEVYWDTNGDGVVSKDQHYSEATGLLHYTLYAAVAPNAEYAPFFINDRATVEYDGYTWIVQGFDADHCRNLEVYAQDVANWPIKDFPAGAGEKKELVGYDYHDALAENVPGYDPKSMDNYIYWLYDGIDDVKAADLYIYFGMDSEYAKGHWKYDLGRLITVEYDLDVTNGLTLCRVNDDGTSVTVTLTKEDVLLTGISNKVTLQYGPFFPSYKTFFSNGEKLNKTGKLDKINNTIDYTVSLNLSDSTVWEYLLDVGNQGAPITSAAFYDDYADGWDYVNGTLTATTYGKNGEVFVYPYTPGAGDYYTRGSITEDDFGDGDIKAYLWNFGNNSGLLCWAFADTYSTLVDRLEFTYTLKASDEWLKEHAYSGSETNVHNRAVIEDNTMPHWDAEADVPYFPNRLNKTAEQDGTSNLIRFKLEINSIGADLDPDKDYLIVTDESSGIVIDPNSIEVTDESGNKLTGLGYTTEGGELTLDQWGFLPSEKENQYRLKIPDGKKLFINYQASIPEMGEVEVSNKASIDGVDRADSSYDGALVVDKVYAGGEGNTYRLTTEKTDSQNASRKLKGAEFKFYMVKKEGESWEDTKTFTIDGENFSCYSKDDWQFETNESGTFTITGWNLEPGRYYILEELEAPDGYQKLEGPVLFYYGLEDRSIPAGVTVAVPYGVLTVGDPPVQYKLPESGGPGTWPCVLAGLALVLGGAVWAALRRRRAR